MRTSIGRSRAPLVAVISCTFMFCGKPDLARGQQAVVTNKTLLPPMSDYVPMTAEDRWNDYVRQNFARPGVFFQTFLTALGDQTGNVPSEQKRGQLSTTSRFRICTVHDWRHNQIHDCRRAARRYEVLFLFTAVLRQGQVPQANIVHVEIGGLRNDKGQVFCAFYSSPDGFPKNSEKAVARIKSAISDKQAVCEFSGMAPGTYAVSVFHDENSNGKLDTNFMGIPREGVGASNGAKGHFGPPKFDAAAFRFSGGRLDLKITINYL